MTSYIAHDVIPKIEVARMRNRRFRLLRMRERINSFIWACAVLITASRNENKRFGMTGIRTPDLEL